jgi:hypothetical protein
VTLGHGWVRRRTDGFKANCGGPAICTTCAAELAGMGQPQLAPPEPQPPVDDGIDHLPGCVRGHRKDQVCRMADTWDANDATLHLTAADLEALGRVGGASNASGG